MVPRGSKVFIDANAIAGAHGTGCLRAIAAVYRLHSTDLCIEEATRRNWFGQKLVCAEPGELKRLIRSCAMSEDEAAQLDFLIEGAVDLHAGEKGLLTLALAEGDAAWWLCGPDAGTLRALHHLAMHDQFCSMDRMCALETLAKGAGLRKRFEGDRFKLSEKWLQEKRTEILLG